MQMVSINDIDKLLKKTRPGDWFTISGTVFQENPAQVNHEIGVSNLGAHNGKQRFFRSIS